ncbi:MAG: metallophosphoesterase [Nanoarchaeota archaeon]|mgnify:CR=1 FL=1
MKIELKKQQNIYFTADSHYSHLNICKGTSNWPDLNNTRDFDNIENMNQTIINNINNKIKEDDILYHLGDWSFGPLSNIQYFRSKINCKNIHLILGNHDKQIRKNKDNIQSLFLSIQDYMEININNQKIILMHYPIASWILKNHGSIMLHGHCHSKYQGGGKILDVGIDNYYKLFSSYDPFFYEEILKIIDKKLVY